MTVFGNASDWETPGLLVSELSHCFAWSRRAGYVCPDLSPSDTSQLSCSVKSSLLQTWLISTITFMLDFTIAPLPDVSSGILNWGRKDHGGLTLPLSFSAAADVLLSLVFQWCLSDDNISWRWGITLGSNIYFLIPFLIQCRSPETSWREWINFSSELCWPSLINMNKVSYLKSQICHFFTELPLN